MLSVIMTRSLIRLGNTVRASLNNNCMTNSHGERERNKPRDNNDNNDITIRVKHDNDRIDRDRIKFNDYDSNGYN